MGSERDEGRQELRKLLLEVEKEMKAALTKARLRYRHSGTKGDESEEAFREILREYLPRSMDVGYGEVVDKSGARSRETDVVVVTPDHPMTFGRSRAGLFFVEGVAAAGEVKARLTTDELGDATRKASRFETLRANHPIHSQFYGPDSDLKRFVESPPWFLLAYESDLSLATIASRLAGTAVDAAFVLDRGWAINFGDGRGAFVFVGAEIQRVSGWAHKESDAVLLDLLCWLSVTMVRVTNSVPILPTYLLPSAATAHQP